MTNCRACGADISEKDRFCRNCGDPIAARAGENADTNRFAPPHSQPAGDRSATNDPTIKFYEPPSVAYAVAQPSPATSQIGSHGNRFIHHWSIWFVIPLLLSIIMAIGVTVGVNSRRSGTPYKSEEAAASRRSHQETIQNALGFNPASVSSSEYPAILGVFIESLISDDSPAALGSIRAGDVLMEVNDQGVRNLSELAAALEPLQPGSDVPVKIYRDGEIIASRVKTGDQAYPPLQPKIPPKDQGFLGLTETNRRCCIPGTKKWGVEIVRVVDNSPADLMGLQSGDVIIEFQGQPIRTPGELNRRIRSARPRSKAAVKFYRGNTEQTIELVLGHR